MRNRNRCEDTVFLHVVKEKELEKSEKSSRLRDFLGNNKGLDSQDESIPASQKLFQKPD